MNDKPAASEPKHGRRDNGGGAPSSEEQGSNPDGNADAERKNKWFKGIFRELLAKTEFWLATGTWALAAVT
jgi:hypothetical protein